MIRSPRGVEDILPLKISSYQWVEREASLFFSRYGYEEIRTPIFEQTDLFLRSIGRETDAGKNMYTFQDKKGRSLSLRPEATASIIRAYIQHKLYAKEDLWRVYYMGSMFRYERPQRGRLREFHQIGVETIGQGSAWVDVELVEMVVRFFKGLGLFHFNIRLNSIGCRGCRASYEKELKKYLEFHLDSLCSVCQERARVNTLRALDCKNDKCQSIIREAPGIEGYLCQSCLAHFEKVRGGLKEVGVKFTVDSHLVRGLDYYTRTIFEIISSNLGAQDTVCGGGRYDDLVEDLEGPPTPAMGFSIGVERLLDALEKEGIAPPFGGEPTVYIVTLDGKSQIKGYELANFLRLKGVRTQLNLIPRGLSSQLKLVNRKKIRWTIIVGEKEVKEKTVILRDMESGKQETIEQGKWNEISQKLGHTL